jgi:hypothetical protein
MSSDLNSSVENPARIEQLRKFYELVVSGQYISALEIIDNQGDLAGESERIIIEILRLKQGIQKYVG